MRTIEIEDGTFERLLERARGEGFADLPAYLESLASEEDDFVMTPEIEAALEEGLEDIRQGRVVTLEESRRELEAHKAEWLARRA